MARSGGHSTSLPHSIGQSSSEGWLRFKGKIDSIWGGETAVVAKSHCKKVHGEGLLLRQSTTTLLNSFLLQIARMASVICSRILTDKKEAETPNRRLLK